ncbi:AMP-binding protein [Massilia niastensis]|uniref:AMP-binding protein n=1 Tax=Massilia niastensis TaxID=544911 RepID=UPI0003A10A7C|nr:AMP-binding protein [Massilia niastensis]
MPDVFFACRLREHASRTAIVCHGGRRLTYAELADAVDAQAAALAGPARLVIVEAENTVECVVAYLACLKGGHPVILAEPGSTAADDRTSVTYGAALVFRRSAQAWGFEQLASARPVALHPDLCILLSTSGTTGSPKLVRLSQANIGANAASIADYLGITPDDRAITSLPLYYSYGMSVLNSHLHAGATVLLTASSVADAGFWTFFEQERATSLSGVPFTFDLLERMGFRSRHYPSLRYLAQAGGRLPAERVSLYGQWAAAAGKQMFVMYGQTEAGPRMAYVPPAQLLDNVDAIGIPIPGGSFELVGEDGAPVGASDTPGELVYRGPNVMMGYAESADDLARDSGPRELRTGDLACRKANGCYAIIGRKSRFSKIVGLRISLDEIERWINGYGVQGIVSGDDRLIVAAVTDRVDTDDLKARLAQRFSLPSSALAVIRLAVLPVLSSNKFDYRAVLRLGHEAAERAHAAPRSLVEAYREVLGNADVRPSDSFLDLGGDSISLVELSLALESHLGFVPENWEARSIASLEALRQGAQPAPDAAAASPAKGARKGSLLQAGLVMLGLLVAGEAVLQARSYLKTGRSALNMVTKGSTVVMNEKYGVRTYRPNMKDENPDDGLEFTTNSLGFRSAEVPLKPAPGELRIVVVGASTVSGAYAKTNDATFPSLLEQRLRREMPGRLVNVINAGVEGYSVREMDQLVERGIIPLQPTMVLVYAGFNDMANICRASAKGIPDLQPLPAPSLPRWVMSRELISKNTVHLRETPVRASAVDPEKHFPDSYAANLDGIVTRLTAAGIEPVLLTVARAFKPGDGEEGRRLATTALFYNHCLDYEGLNKAGSLFNRTIAEVATNHGVTLVDLGNTMPGGPKYFVDAAHFTRLGEETASSIIYHELFENTALAHRMSPLARK